MATILVIDDDLDLQQMLRLMLQRGGYKVVTTGDGPDGLAKAKALRPDMAIVDVMMPGMNGYQVVRKMREDPELHGMVDPDPDCARSAGRSRSGHCGAGRRLHAQALCAQ